MLLSGILVSMGFFSCYSAKQMTKKIDKAEKLINERKTELNTLKENVKQLESKHANYLNIIETLKNPPKVYGPPVLR